jgi:hypothetical protein
MISMAAQCLGRIRRSAWQKQFDALQQQIHSLDPADPARTNLLKEAQSVRLRLEKLR